MNKLFTLYGFTLCGVVLLAGCCANSTHQQYHQSSNQSYQCDNGLTIQAEYPNTDEAKIRLDGKTLDMQITRSASGARYASKSHVWWTKGANQASLFAYDAKQDETGRLITECKAAAN